MAVRKTRAIRVGLEAKGFREAENDHTRLWYYWTTGAKSSIQPKVSHGPGSDTYDDHLLGKVAKQLRLTNHDALGLIDCPMTQAAYEERLRAQGLDPSPQPASTRARGRRGG